VPGYSKRSRGGGHPREPNMQTLALRAILERRILVMDSPWAEVVGALAPAGPSVEGAPGGAADAPSGEDETESAFPPEASRPRAPRPRSPKRSRSRISTPSSPCTRDRSKSAPISSSPIPRRQRPGSPPLRSRDRATELVGRAVEAARARSRAWSGATTDPARCRSLRPCLRGSRRRRARVRGSHRGLPRDHPGGARRRSGSLRPRFDRRNAHAEAALIGCARSATISP